MKQVFLTENEKRLNCAQCGHSWSLHRRMSGCEAGHLTRVACSCRLSKVPFRAPEAAAALAHTGVHQLGRTSGANNGGESHGR